MHCSFFRGNQFSSFLPARTAALEAKRSGSPGCTALFSREPVFLIPSGWDRSPGSQEIGLAGVQCTFFSREPLFLIPFVSRTPLAAPDFLQQFFL
jgi:hypothetical protein